MAAKYLYLEDGVSRLQLESGDFYLLEDGNTGADDYTGPRTSRTDDIRQTRTGDIRVPRGYAEAGASVVPVFAISYQFRRA